MKAHGWEQQLARTRKSSEERATLNRSTPAIKFDIFNFTYIFALIHLVNDDGRKVTIPFTSPVSKTPSILSTEVLPIIATTF